MACETFLRPRQTPAERKVDIRKAVDRLSKGLSNGTIKAKIGPQGAIAFEGFNDRDGVTDACAYHKLMVYGSATAKLAVAKAEQLAGRSIDRTVLASGVHSHDGGKNWQEGH